MSFTFFSFSKGRSHRSESGLEAFTLIELLVCVAIIAIITAIVVFRQGNLSDEVSVSNVANDISLQVRQAQVYGISVRELAPASDQFSIAYGVDFNLGSLGTNSSFVSFADQGSQNGYYDAPGTCILSTSECLSQSSLTGGNTIGAVCEIPSSGSEVCSPTVSRVDITFLRPDPSARITFFNASGGLASYPNSIGADIEIKSPQGLIKHVYVYKTGQISVP